MYHSYGLKRRALELIYIYIYVHPSLPSAVRSVCSDRNMGNIQQARVDFCRCIPIDFVGPKNSYCKKNQAAKNIPRCRTSSTETNSKFSPEDGWLEDDHSFPFWGKRPIFRGKLAFSFSECTSSLCFLFLHVLYFVTTATGISRHHSRWQRLEAGLLKRFFFFWNPETATWNVPENYNRTQIEPKTEPLHIFLFLHPCWFFGGTMV